MAAATPPVSPPPPRGRRPRNRRELIVAAANDLFARHGYSQVGMSDLADAVGISRPALYRHFTNKQDLLAEVVTQAITRTEEALGNADSDDLDSVLRAVAGAVLDHRGAGALWQRDARHLPDEQRRPLRERNKAMGETISKLLRARRPELDEPEATLLTWCGLAVATSVSFHDLDLPRDELEELVADLLHRVISTELPSPASPDEGAPSERRAAEPHPALTTQSRWEQLLDTAAVLFAERGYNSVGMDEIAAAVGIAGPSIYNHFAGKAEILTAAMYRGAEWLRYDLHRVLDTAADPADALHLLIEADTRFVLRHSHLVDLLIAEAPTLPADTRRQLNRALRDYNADWIHLLRAVHPDLDPARATIRVQAFFSLINNVARSPRLRRQPGAQQAVERIGSAVLGLPPR